MAWDRRGCAGGGFALCSPQLYPMSPSPHLIASKPFFFTGATSCVVLRLGWLLTSPPVIAGGSQGYGVLSEICCARCGLSRGVGTLCFSVCLVARGRWAGDDVLVLMCRTLLFLSLTLGPDVRRLQISSRNRVRSPPRVRFSFTPLIPILADRCRSNFSSLPLHRVMRQGLCGQWHATWPRSLAN